MMKPSGGYLTAFAGRAAGAAFRNLIFRAFSERERRTVIEQLAATAEIQEIDPRAVGFLDSDLRGLIGVQPLVCGQNQFRGLLLDPHGEAVEGAEIGLTI